MGFPMGFPIWARAHMGQAHMDRAHMGRAHMGPGPYVLTSQNQQIGVLEKYDLSNMCFIPQLGVRNEPYKGF